MKVKNIAFSGFMAAILMGAVATPADAVSVASREYVDARETAINTNLTQNYLNKTDAGNTYVTKTDAEAFQDADDVSNAITNAVTGNEALAGALADKEDKDNKVGAITKEQLDAMTASDKANKYASIEAAEDIAEISAAKINEVGGEVLELSNQVSANTTAISTLNGTGDGSVAKQIADSISELNLAGTYEEKGTAKGLIDGLTGADGQVGKNTAAIATNAQDIATNAQGIADNAEDIAKNAEDIAKKADAEATTTALAGKVNATGQTANQIMITDAEGKVVTTAKISAEQVDALGRLATAEVPESCTNDSGTMCVLSINQEGKYAWTAITEPTTQNP